MGVMERTSRATPCIFCGDIGYDMRVTYPDSGNVVHWCHKTHAQKGDIRFAGGEKYICIAEEKSIKIGKFDLWKKYVPEDEWKKSRPARWDNSFDCAQKPGELLPGECKTLANKELDERNRFFLSLLVLEEKHKQTLLAEWKGPFADLSILLDLYPIRSMPPLDKIRFLGNNKNLFKNDLRKKIVASCLKQFGDLRGWPMFYLRGGEYWANKPESERWTIAAPEGIIFPCYDKDGYLYRIRIKDDYPDMEIKEGKMEPFEGEYGYFTHAYSESGQHQWFFVPKGGSKYLVFEKGKVEKISLTQNYLPAIGKPRGKYKNLSSVYAKMIDGVACNVMEGGSRSGSPYSLYTHPGDNFAVVIGTEGEKKGMVTNAIKKVPVLTVSGVWNIAVLFDKDVSGESAIDALKKRGMKVFVLAYDADKDSNEDVLTAQNTLAERLTSEGVQVLIANWKSRFDKGIDDILLMGLDYTVERY